MPDEIPADEADWLCFWVLVADGWRKFRRHGIPGSARTQSVGSPAASVPAEGRISMTQASCFPTEPRVAPPPAPAVAVVIPAYRPGARLVELVHAVLACGREGVIVVDDGSGAESEQIFRQVQGIPGVQLLRHSVNLGKGAALKTAIHFALCHYRSLAGIVTMDADGQHDPQDVRRVAEEFRLSPVALVLGVRDFDGELPLRSKVGNRITRHVLRATLGQRLTDTQTGLRAIPRSMLPDLLRIQATGYEFEMEMLVLAKYLKVSVIERPIRTIYEDGNRCSHFRPVLDSMRIYWVLVRFVGIAMLSAVLDNAAFYGLFAVSGSLLESQVGARILSLLFNYPAVRRQVFHSDARHRHALPRYLLLAGVNLGLANFGVRLAFRYGIAVLPAKLLVDGLLFVFSFLAQRGLVFVRQHRALRGGRFAPPGHVTPERP